MVSMIGIAAAMYDIKTSRSICLKHAPFLPTPVFGSFLPPTPEETIVLVIEPQAASGQKQLHSHFRLDLYSTFFLNRTTLDTSMQPQAHCPFRLSSPIRKTGYQPADAFCVSGYHILSRSRDDRSSWPRLPALL